MKKGTIRFAAVALGLGLAAAEAMPGPDGWTTAEPAQVSGDTPATGEGWEVHPLVTIGEQNAAGADVNLQQLGVRPPGILDGMGAFRWTKHTVRVFVNHELGATTGYAYRLANGTTLTGARVSWFDIDRKSRKVCGSGPAYDRVFDRSGNVVTSASQINEGGSGGFDRFCSAHGFADGESGFHDDIYFCGEETDEGQECAIDVRGGDLYVAPMLGRAAWENLCALENFRSDKIVLLLSDDTTPAPFYLYVGKRGSAPAQGYDPPRFLKRNGLGLGQLYVWVSDSGDLDPTDFRGTGASRKGKFKRIGHFDPSRAGTPGWDALGFAKQQTQYDAANALGAFLVARPEDVSANPEDGTEAVAVATGASGFAGGADSWGTVYLVDLDDRDLAKQLDKDLSKIETIKATIRILYDGNDSGDGQFPAPDYGLRSPDNLDWADDGTIYIQEDDAIGGFGATSHVEASVWQLDPCSGEIRRILEIDRGAVPRNQTDTDPGDIGDWETSGVLDVTELFKVKRGETLLLLDVQAHSLRGGGLKQNAASESADLVQGGQLLLVSKTTTKRARDDDEKDD